MFKDLGIGIYGTPDEPLFKGSEVANVLEITNAREMFKDFNEIEKLTEEDKKNKENVPIFDKTNKPNPKMIILTEAGVYRLLFTSRVQKAKEFRLYLYKVLKEIRLETKKELQDTIIKLKNDNHQLLHENILWHSKTKEYQREMCSITAVNDFILKAITLKDCDDDKYPSRNDKYQEKKYSDCEECYLDEEYDLDDY